MASRGKPPIADRPAQADLYDRDFLLWTERTAELIRQGRVSEVDLQHVAEEVEDMGKSQKHEAASRLNVILKHLIKWQIQPGRRGASWSNTLRAQRRDLARALEDMPSLKRYLAERLHVEYNAAVEDAIAETGQRVELPERCPFSLEQALDIGFLPTVPTSGSLAG